MPENSMRHAIATAFLTLLTACNPGVSELNNRLLWDAEGCAYVVEVDIGTKIRRVADADKTTCSRKK